MTYVVQEACVKCKYADCVEVCPVNCFFEDNDMLVINPEECIDCSACVPACPVEAIVSEDDAEHEWLEKNAKFNFQEEKRRDSKDDVTPGEKNTEIKSVKKPENNTKLNEYKLSAVITLPSSIDKDNFIKGFKELVENHGGMVGDGDITL